MSKINLNTFKTVTIVLFVFAGLFTSNAAWGQADNPQSGGSIRFPARIFVSQPFPTTGTYQNVAVRVSCKIWDPDPSRKTWNGVNTTKVNTTTKKTVRLENAETKDINFPINLTTRQITAADVDRYFTKAYGDAGYTKKGTTTASFAMNCHGYSTGKNCWLNDCITLLLYDYTPETIAKYLAEVGVTSKGVILKTGDHSVLARTTARKVNGEIEYKIVTTSEQFLVSATYEKEINQTYTATDNIAVDITASFNNRVHTSVTVGYYWYPKK